MPSASPSSGSCNYPQTKVDQTPKYGVRRKKRKTASPMVRKMNKVKYL